MASKNKFSDKVIQIVSKIPKGKTLTYKQVAKKAGNEKAARAVGNIINRYYYECVRLKKPAIPCHRVILSDGKIGGYAKGEKEKRKLLKKERAIGQQIILDSSPDALDGRNFCPFSNTRNRSAFSGYYLFY